MRIACWITHPKYEILIAFPRQPWLRERASILPLYVHSFSFSLCNVIIFTNRWKYMFRNFIRRTTKRKTCNTIPRELENISWFLDNSMVCDLSWLTTFRNSVWVPSLLVKRIRIFLFVWPVKMEPTRSYETSSVNSNRTQCNYPKITKQYWSHGENLKSKLW
jgi:hypothetical protein